VASRQPCETNKHFQITHNGMVERSLELSKKKLPYIGENTSRRGSNNPTGRFEVCRHMRDLITINSMSLDMFDVQGQATIEKHLFAVHQALTGSGPDSGT
jgi:hypothetical protein